MDVSGFVGMSHAPQWDLDFDHQGPGEQYVAAVADARDQVTALEADVLVLFGPDHFRNFFYDTMPPFCIGAEAIDGFGDYGSPKGPLPGASDLAKFVVDRVMGEGFDPAVSLKMGVDHGIAQPFAALTKDRPAAMLPIMINCSGGAMPSMRRCHAFGAAVGRAVRAFPASGRAVIVGSGGMSHTLQSSSPFDPAVPPAHRDYVINGRSRVEQHNAALEAKVVEFRETGFLGPVNADWDQQFLNRIVAGDLEPLLSLDDDEMLRLGGVGAYELRTWMAALGAWDGPVEGSSYEPVPSWITGMGVASSGRPPAAAAHH